MRFILIFFFIICSIGIVKSQDGNSISIKSHNATHLASNGNYNQWTVFPTGKQEFRKIIMYFTLGCPEKGCSAWDYTTQIEALLRTGKKDTLTKTQASFLVNGEIKNILSFSIDSTFKISYDTTKKAILKIPARKYEIVLFENKLNLNLATDTIIGWESDFYQYKYNDKGEKVDSSFFKSQKNLKAEFINYTSIEERIIPIELGRFMTPYSGDLMPDWKRTWDFDVTDYAPILKDSLEIRIFYGGWEDGFTVTLDFEFIKGTPVRNVLSVNSIWNSGPKGFLYGDSIITPEMQMKPFDFMFGKDVGGAKVRVVPSGHSFGGAEDCAEFCAKNYFIAINDSVTHKQLMWRSDCGLNPMYPQPGTWLYDRANWCPGAIALAHDHEIYNSIKTNQKNKISIHFDDYKYTGGAGFPPNYIMDAQLFTYSKPNFSNDVSIEEIIAPSVNPNHSRYNPISTNPIIVIKNNGKENLKSVEIEYGFDKAKSVEYEWKGNLKFLESDTVILGKLSWDNISNNKFLCILEEPNGKKDEYSKDNSMVSFAQSPIYYPNKFVVFTKTNDSASENSYYVLNESNDTVLQKKNLLKRTIYRDTLNLTNGNYSFVFEDSRKDGLSFWANPEAGDGEIMFRNANDSTDILKFFNPDFGTHIIHNFSIGTSSGFSEIFKNTEFYLYPNAPGLNFYLEKPGMENANVKVLTSKGEIVTSFIAKAGKRVVSVDMKTQKRGAYYVHYTVGEKTTIKKIIYRVPKK